MLWLLASFWENGKLSILLWFSLFLVDEFTWIGGIQCLKPGLNPGKITCNTSKIQIQAEVGTKADRTSNKQRFHGHFILHRSQWHFPWWSSLSLIEHGRRGEAASRWQRSEIATFFCFAGSSSDVRCLWYYNGLQSMEVIGDSAFSWVTQRSHWIQPISTLFFNHHFRFGFTRSSAMSQESQPNTLCALMLIAVSYLSGSWIYALKLKKQYFPSFWNCDVFTCYSPSKNLYAG